MVPPDGRTDIAPFWRGNVGCAECRRSPTPTIIPAEAHGISVLYHVRRGHPDMW